MENKINQTLIKYSSICAILAIQPLPFADIFILTPVQALMGKDIAKQYGINLTQQELIDTVRQLMGIIGLGVFAQQLAIGLYKFIPYFGAITTIPTVFGLTYAMGKLMDKYFQSKSQGYYIDEAELKKIFNGALKEGKEKAKEYKKQDMQAEYEKMKTEMPDFYETYYKEKLEYWDRFHQNSEDIAKSKHDSWIFRKEFSSPFFIPKNIEIVTNEEEEKIGKIAEAKALELIQNQLMTRSDKYRLIYSKNFDFKLNGYIYLGEIDFILFHLDYGFLVIEVKNSIKRDEQGRITYKNGKDLSKVFAQLEKNKNALITFMKSKIPGIEYKIRFETAVLVPEKENIIGGFTMQDKVISSEDFVSNIESVFARRGGAVADKSFVQKALNLMLTVEKEQSPIEKILAYKEKNDKENDKQLDKDSFNIHLNTLIVGGPGTGKTYHAIRTIEKSVNSFGRILYLCYNRSLAQDIKELFTENENVQVDNIHRFDYDLDRDNFDKSLESLANLNRLEAFDPKYDMIVIDEAQDFEFLWIEQIMEKLLDSSGKVLICADETQNIFNKNFIKEYFRRMAEGEEMPEALAKLQVYFLYRNYRNCVQIHKFIEQDIAEMRQVEYSNIFQSGFTRQLEIQNASELLPLLNDLVEELGISSEDGVSKVLLSDRKFEKIFDEDSLAELEGLRAEIGLNFSTVQGYKGLESDVVIYFQVNNAGSDYDQAINYEAMTRARYALVVIKLNRH